MTTPKPQIFICYRREDSNTAAWAIYERLKAVFGESAVFIDRVDFKPGQDWREKTRPAVEAAQAVVVVIQKQWIAIAKERFQDKADPVRRELELSRQEDAAPGKLVIPVAVDDTPLPTTADLETFRPLPLGESTIDLLSWLFGKTALRIRFDSSIDSGMRDLIEALDAQPGIDRADGQNDPAGSGLAGDKPWVFTAAAVRLAWCVALIVFDVLWICLVIVRGVAPLYAPADPMLIAFAALGICFTCAVVTAAWRPRLVGTGTIARRWLIVSGTCLIVFVGLNGVYRWLSPLRFAWNTTGLDDACAGSKYFADQQISAPLHPKPCTIFESEALALTLRTGIWRPTSPFVVQVDFTSVASTKLKYILANTAYKDSIVSRTIDEKTGEVALRFAFTDQSLKSSDGFTLRVLPEGSKDDTYSMVATGTIGTRPVAREPYVGTIP